MSRVALPAAVLAILATMLAGAYAMEAYAPAGTRIVRSRGVGRDGRPTDAVELIGIRQSVLRGLRDRAESDVAWTSAIRVVVDNQPAGQQAPPVLGRYAVIRDRVRFEPRFPFTPGVEYRVDVDARRLATLAAVATSGAERAELTHRFSIPTEKTERTTRVAAVHPAADRLPSNMLRWYIEFSAPMEPGSAHEHVQLLDEAGRPVNDAFLRVDEELWDADRRRLTLFFDPGRVKQGVRANVEMGAPLIEGHRYRLAIDAAWLDARGSALASGFEKEFDVGPADRESPDPRGWTVASPPAGTRRPLRVSFGEPLDHALAKRMLNVEIDRQRIDGVALVVAGDSVWTFTPSSPWPVGTYRIRVDATLEDIAGNSIARLFDADRERGAPAAEAKDRLGRSRSIGFRVQ